MELIGLLAILATLAFIATCFCWIKCRAWTDPAVKNKVKYFFQIWGYWTVTFATFWAFAYKLM